MPIYIWVGSAATVADGKDPEVQDSKQIFEHLSNPCSFFLDSKLY